MKKVLSIANMLFTSAIVLGMAPNDSNENLGMNKRRLSLIRKHSEEQSMKKRLRTTIKHVRYVEPYIDDRSSLYQRLNGADDFHGQDYRPSSSIKNNNHSQMSQWQTEADDFHGQDYRPSSSAKKNKDSFIYQETELNLIYSKESLQKHKEFPYVEKLKVSLKDLFLLNSSKFPKLKELSIDSRIVGKEISKDKKKKKSIITNYFSRDYMPSLLKFLQENPNLESISLVRCKNLKKISPILKNSSNLKSLTLKFLEMTRVLPAIGNLIELRKLDLSNNKISKLSESMINLKKLEELTLIGNNFLLIFPKVITKLPNLKILRIDERQANSWKESLLELKRTKDNLKVEIWHRDFINF